jgi:hypothetical protein
MTKQQTVLYVLKTNGRIVPNMSDADRSVLQADMERLNQVYSSDRREIVELIERPVDLSVLVANCDSPDALWLQVMGKPYQVPSPVSGTADADTLRQCAYPDSAVPDAAKPDPSLSEIPPHLDVRRIMLKVVPDGDGDPVEIYAKSVADVETVMSDICLRLEEYELGIRRYNDPSVKPETVTRADMSAEYVRGCTDGWEAAKAAKPETQGDRAELIERINRRVNREIDFDSVFLDMQLLKEAATLLSTGPARVEPQDESAGSKAQQQADAEYGAEPPPIIMKNNSPIQNKGWEITHVSTKEGQRKQYVSLDPKSTPEQDAAYAISNPDVLITPQQYRDIMAGLLVEIAKQQEEIRITDQLLNERNSTLALIPGCHPHGDHCQPYYRKWIDKARITMTFCENLIMRQGAPKGWNIQGSAYVAGNLEISTRQDDGKYAMEVVPGSLKSSATGFFGELVGDMRRDAELLRDQLLLGKDPT